MLKGCLGGYTQNNFEAFNHLIWSRCPKSVFSGRDHLDSAIAMSVVVLNEGLSAVGNVPLHLGIEPGSNTMTFFSKIDRKHKRECCQCNDNFKDN